MDQGGVTLLSMTASDAEDPQTLRMVAGAIANLCGNGNSEFLLVMQGFGLLQDSNALNGIHQKSNTLDEPIIGCGRCPYKHLDSFFSC